MSQVQHVIPTKEYEAHDLSWLCICAPVFVMKTSGVRVDLAYWEHFKLHAADDPHQELL